MPRQARERSSTGIYHVVLKGIDDRDIFLDDQDRQKFLEQLWRAKDKDNFEILVYCLMDNHVHLLIKENEDVGKSIQRLASGYAIWHNEKYDRRGHLFYNRYCSEIVESESYLLSVARYIIQNPVKAGIVSHAGEYKWSSYQDYLTAFSNTNYAIASKLIMDYFLTPKDYTAYMNQRQDDRYLDYDFSSRFSDDEIRKIIREKYSIMDSTKLLTKEERNTQINEIYNDTQVSIRQLGRVLGIGKKIIEKAVRQTDAHRYEKKLHSIVGN
ncbi:transposase [Dehalobacter sp. DCM]|uniref:transposase n=1 Tax=Dehalobacter sp. DCM TaxID=2907827 RepID=UPI003081ADC4|nr:transposase [Dehalobacter sp. DCM]